MPEESKEPQAEAPLPVKAPEQPEADKSDMPESPQKSHNRGKSSGWADPLPEFDVNKEVRYTRLNGTSGKYIVANSRLNQNRMWEYQLRETPTTLYGNGQWIAESRLSWP